MKFEFLNNLSGACVLLTVTLVFSMLYEPRYPMKKYLKSLIPFLTILFAVNFYEIFTIGFADYGRVTLFTATLPSLLYFFITSKYRDGRFLFTFCLIDTSSILFAVLSGFVDYSTGSDGLFNFIIRIVSTPFILVAVWKWGRQSYLKLLHTVKKGWWLFTTITSVAYLLLIVISSVPVSLRERPDDMPVALLVSLLLPLTYCIIFYVLTSQRKLHEMGSIQHAFSMQSAMMKNKADEIHNAEEKIRIERHDLRHQFNIIEELARNNKIDELLNYIGDVQKNLNESAVVHYCTNPILDAILTHYFKQAENAGIKVEKHISIPENIPVSDTEIATVFANTLENAINATSNLPKEKRKIIFNCISHPTLMFEIKNPYEGKIEFDSDGLPVSSIEGHGIGSKSVLAFCKKHDATYIYEAKNGWFRIMISL